jgi:lysine-N-methylase
MAILHPSRSLSALVPQYASRFSCIGSSCEDTCCAGWQVSIDKKTFTAYRQSNHVELKAAFDTSLKRTRSQASASHYAHIELEQESGNCPLAQDRLCSVQKNLNETYLSDTCFSFPRSTRQFAGGIEQSLTLSCPEAARQALLSADAFDFVESRIQVRDSTLNGIRSMHGLGPESMNEIRIFCFQLMRAEGLALWQKLAALGVFCESLTQAIDAHRQAGIPALIQDFIALLESGAIVQALQDLTPNHVSQALVFSTLWQMPRGTAPSASQRDIIDMIAQGMATDEMSERSRDEQIVDNYRRGLERLPAALQDAPYMLEHYVLNEMFSNLFPFGDATPYEHYLRLISRFGMVRFMLAAQCNSSESLPSPALLALTVQVFCRRFQHDRLFARHTSEVLHKSGWDRLEKLYGFLRY